MNSNTDPRVCTCHPDDSPPTPCPRRYALSECRSAAGQEPIAWMVVDESGQDAFVTANPALISGNQRALPLYTTGADELRERCEQQAAQIERLRADAERYRWLRGDVAAHSTRWSRWRIEHWASPGPTWSDIRGDDLDAAIDAAMRAVIAEQREGKV
jgi:hypothetical protein